MPLQIPHPSTALHLYRHLLREATYLPPLCRPWVTSRIEGRYRDCRGKKDVKPYVQEAHHHLRYLRSANTGHTARVLHLCYLATGRVGKRRRQLATAFLKKQPAEDSDALESQMFAAMSDQASSPGATIQGQEKDWLDKWAIDKLHAMAASQVQAQGGDWPYSMRRTYDPKLPPTNSFGRPLGKKLVRNKLKRHYASVLRQMLPPLPQGEWDRLRDLANGEGGSPADMKMPYRRPVAQPTSENHEEDASNRDWDWLQYVNKPVRAVERKNSRKMKSLTGELDQDPRGQGRPIGIRTLGPRRLRRGIYSRIFQQSPIMTENEKSGKWSVKWGSSELKLSGPARTDLQFFQGVGANGELPK